MKFSALQNDLRDISCTKGDICPVYKGLNNRRGDGTNQVESGFVRLRHHLSQAKRDLRNKLTMAVTLNCLKARVVRSVEYYCMLRHRRRKLTFIYLYLTVDVQCHLEVFKRVKDGIGYIKLLSAEQRM
jgi:hypothetical protein